MRPLRRLRGDDRGALLIFVAVALAALLGLVALSFDLGRMAATQTELQSFADNVALAAAAELDGKTDSIDRAKTAANALITDRQSFGEGGRTLDQNDFRLTFLSDLDPDDQPNAAGVYGDTVLTEPFDGTEQRTARLVQVDIVPREVELTFASALFSLTRREEPNSDVAASAVAGFTQVACRVTPLMFCMPDASFDAADRVGDTIVLRSARQNAAWQPGNFGFLDPSTTAIPAGPCLGMRPDSQELWRCLVGAAGSVTTCFDIRGVDTQPGERNGLAEAFNVRFDLYRSTMNKLDKSANYAPAPVVIDGIATESSCKETPTTPNVSKPVPAAEQSLPVPVDDCMRPGQTCTGGTLAGENRFGDGEWSIGRREYLEWNYGDRDISTPLPAPFNAWNTTMATRWELYQAEVARSDTTRPLLPSPRQETGLPQCNTNTLPGTVLQRAERRTVVAAAIDCSAPGFSGSANIPVEQFVKIFILQPVRERTATDATGKARVDFDLVGEVIGPVGGAGSTVDGTFRDVVQLYR